MTCCRFFFLIFSFLFAPLFPPPTGLMPVSSSSSSWCFFPCSSSYLFRVVLSVQQVSVSLQDERRCSSGNCNLSFPFRSCIIFFRTPVSFVLFCFLFLFSLIYISFSAFFFRFCFFHLFLWSGVFCCGLAPCTLAFHLLYLDELRPTVWFTVDPALKTHRVFFFGSVFNAGKCL